jgi:uncharacterized protein YjbI with pentapeptide repeats
VFFKKVSFMHPEDHVEIIKNALKQGGRKQAVQLVDEATEGLIRRTGKGLHLADADLSGLDLSGFNLRKANLNRARLYSTRLGNANMEGCSMICPGLERTDFSYANLRKAYLHALGAQVCNFAGAAFDDSVDCTGSIFHGCSMKQASFSNCQLAGSSFYQCDLCGANLSGSNLQGCYFNESVLSEVSLRNAQLGQVTFTKCLMDGMNFNGAIGQGLVIQRPTSFTNVTLQLASLPLLRLDAVNGSQLDFMRLDAPGFDCANSSLEAVNFSGSNLCQSRWLTSTIVKGNFHSAKIEESNWCRMQVSEGDFSLSMLENAKFTECNMPAINMQGMKGRCVSFRDCNLTGCDFSNAYLYRAFISGDPPKGMSLRGARLENANLVQAYVAADLTGAELINTLLTYARLNQSVLKNSIIRGGNYYEASFIKVDFTGGVFSGFTPPAFFDRCAGLMEIINKESLNGEREMAIKYITEFQNTVSMTDGSST